MVYELPARAKQAMGLTKRERQFDRTLRYIEELGARVRVPDRRPAVLPRRGAVGLQRHLRRRVEHLPRPDRLPGLAARRRGTTRAGCCCPAPSPTLDEPGCPVVHPYDPATIYASNETKTAYLRDDAGAADARGRGGQGRLGAPRDRHPRRAAGVVHAAAGGGRRTSPPASTAACGSPARTPSAATSTSSSTSSAREVRAYDGEKVRYRFRTRRAYVEQLIAEHEIDWVNSLFLSCRFSAQRIGPYNEFVYVFFKCLSEERLQLRRGLVRRAERRRGGRDDHARTAGTMQRRCPHLKADLSRFGSIDGRRADLPDARLEVAAVRRQVPDLGRPRPALRAGRPTGARRPSRSCTTTTTASTTTSRVAADAPDRSAGRRSERWPRQAGARMISIASGLRSTSTKRRSELGGDRAGRAAAGEEVEHPVAGPRRRLHDAAQDALRLLVRVAGLLRAVGRDDGVPPDVGGQLAARRLLRADETRARGRGCARRRPGRRSARPACGRRRRSCRAWPATGRGPGRRSRRPRSAR